MNTHRLVVAVVAMLLLGSPALAAGQRDKAPCRGNNPSPAIASCGAIISDPTESAEDRANAFLRRSDAYLARGDVNSAIADLSEAIKLKPQNVAAYVSRALAYFRNGDRDRAVIDFAVAERLDGDKAEELGAANPAFAQIAALARGLPPAADPASAAAAGPFCPTGATARDGFVLFDRKTARKQQVDPSNGDVLTNEYFVGDERAMSATYYKGLLIVFASFLESYINSYDIDYTRLGFYQVGQQTLYHGTSVTLDGKARNLTVERRIAGEEKLVIGDCTFDTFVIQSRTLFADGTKAVARSNFSPELRMSLRLTSTAEGADPYEVSYDGIEPLRQR
jgi:tetratricopeptide (TPR) repeat protein